MILIDSSAWIDHFRNDNKIVRELLEQGEALVTGVVLLEITPFLRKEKNSHATLDFFNRLEDIDHEISAVDWHMMTQYQMILVKRGINGVGIPDLMLLHIAKIREVPLFTLDKNLQKAAKALRCELYEGK